MIKRTCDKIVRLKLIAVLLLVALLFGTGSIEALPTTAQLPAKVLDLSNWRLTLPIDTDHPGKPDEIRQPELLSFMDANYFSVCHKPKGVTFRAPCGGATTKGSSYPRCELRETTADGKGLASWATDDGTTHTMMLKLAITKTPTVKPHVVCAQIHDADDDLMMVRLEGTKLFIERNSLDEVSLDRDYKLGTPIELRIEANAGHVKVWHNSRLAMDWKVARKGCYFKAGCYTQSNPSKGDKADATAEVVLYQLHVEHRK